MLVDELFSAIIIENFHNAANIPIKIPQLCKILIASNGRWLLKIEI